MIFTSYFANFDNIPTGRDKVSIARYTPKDIAIESYLPLAPTASILMLYKEGKIDENKYDELYQRVLDTLNPKDIAKKLNGKVLFCYEKPEDFCHRKLVRKWLAKAGYLSLEYQKSYKIAVVGSRNYNNKKEFFAIMQRLLKNFDLGQEIEFVSGGAKGADSFAKDFADEVGISITEYLPNWDKYGKKAGFVRNKDIWKNADFGIAFWDGKSKGTKHSFDIAKSLGKILVVYNYIEKKFYINNFEQPLIRNPLP